MLRSALLLPAAFAAIALTGCDLADDGARVSQTRDVDTFTKIDNDSSVDVRLHVGEPQRVRVRAGEKVIDDVHTDVRDGVLRVRFDHSGFGGRHVVVEASVPALDGINVSGSGDVDADGIRSDAFEVRNDGSADVSLSGSTGRLAVNLDGSGDANVAGLAAQAARVHVSGSGDANVRADDRLDLKLDGSGDIKYAGNPQITKNDDGSGDVKHVD
ncbi:head GIN domain-containing protein [Solirubrobacter soli]|uniref:head GIN domain-containing protein n=1 Tax=Solirubrobacter soli TaxID=363832 RepID=UPI000429369E|nr:head GIN domain-containing protein [Solirubrobacter soli]